MHILTQVSTKIYNFFLFFFQKNKNKKKPVTLNYLIPKSRKKVNKYTHIYVFSTFRKKKKTERIH